MSAAEDIKTRGFMTILPSFRGLAPVSPELAMVEYTPDLYAFPPLSFGFDVEENHDLVVAPGLAPVGGAGYDRPGPVYPSPLLFNA
jgi:hypothetical protein